LVGKYIQLLPDYRHFLCCRQRHNSNLSCSNYGIHCWRYGAGNLVCQLAGILQGRSKRSSRCRLHSSFHGRGMLSQFQLLFFLFNFLFLSVLEASRVLIHCRA
jgi:hypothetical protein